MMRRAWSILWQILAVVGAPTVVLLMVYWVYIKSGAEHVRQGHSYHQEYNK